MMYERTDYSLMLRHIQRAKTNNLLVCDKCNPLTLNCKYCPLSSEFHADFCDVGAFLDKVLK